jgi:hypothetical protein
MLGRDCLTVANEREDGQELLAHIWKCLYKLLLGLVPPE